MPMYKYYKSLTLDNNLITSSWILTFMNLITYLSCSPTKMKFNRDSFKTLLISFYSVLCTVLICTIIGNIITLRHIDCVCKVPRE